MSDALFIHHSWFFYEIFLSAIADVQAPCEISCWGIFRPIGVGALKLKTPNTLIEYVGWPQLANAIHFDLISGFLRRLKVPYTSSKPVERFTALKLYTHWRDRAVVHGLKIPYTSIQIPATCSDLKLRIHWRDQRICPPIENSIHIQRSWWWSSRLENLCTSIQMAITCADWKIHTHQANRLRGLRIENSIHINSNSHWVLGSKIPYTLTWTEGRSSNEKFIHI